MQLVLAKTTMDLQRQRELILKRVIVFLLITCRTAPSWNPVSSAEASVVSRLTGPRLARENKARQRIRGNELSIEPTKTKRILNPKKPSGEFTTVCICHLEVDHAANGRLFSFFVLRRR